MSVRSRCATALLVVVWVASAAARAEAQSVAQLKTAPEATNFRETTRYADVLAFVKAVAEASPRIHLDTMGYTFEGRALPLAIVGDVRDSSPEAVLASGKTRVYVQGNIHAGEVEGKESLLILLREIAQGRHAALLDSLVLLIAPIYNADGNERVELDNRGAQHGPIGGMGTRPNAQGLNLNRDHTKLDSPEARSLAMTLAAYDPHVVMDLHTTNGTTHAYYATYSGPMHPNTDSALVRLMRGRWFPEVTRSLREKYGWDYYYYGNRSGRGGQVSWATFDYRAMFNNNYAGLRNRFGVLSEAYSYATFEDRIKATSRFVEEILAFAMRNARAIRDVTAAADAAPVVGKTLAVRAQPERSTQQVEILMGEVVEERNPYTGARMLRRVDVKRPERMWEYGTYAPTETEVAPAAYLVPAALTNVIANLEAHGVRMQPLAQAGTMAVERFRVDSTRVAANEFEGHQERQVFGAWEPTSQDVPAGTVRVAVDQPLGRLVFSLLEPRSTDGLVNWNYLDRGLEAGGFLPILRVPGQRP